MQSIFTSSKFQEDYKRYKQAIDKLPEGDLKNQTNLLLTKLVAEVKKLDNMHLDLIFTKQLPTLGSEMKDNITDVRKQLDSKLKELSVN
jgi:hypothetical protein